MKLYYSPGACSLAPHIVLEELGLPHELVKVDFDQPPTGFEQANPMGAVPVLVLDDGQPLTEGAAILQYLADRKPEANLAPKSGTPERYRLQEALNFVSTEMHKGIGFLFGVEMMSKDSAAQKEIRAFGVEGVNKRLHVVSEHLGNRDYWLPTGFSVADAYLFTVLSWTKHLKVDLTPYPRVVAFIERVHARPAVQRALKAEGLA